MVLYFSDRAFRFQKKISDQGIFTLVDEKKTDTISRKNVINQSPLEERRLHL